MNSKNIARHLCHKLNDWCKSIDDNAVVDVIKENAIVTGGALVSLLNGEPPNDYDVYFKTYDSALKVASYYADKWNKEKSQPVHVINDTDLYNVCKKNNFVYDILQNKVEGRGKTPLEVLEMIEDSTRDKRISCFVESAGIAKEDGESGIDDESEPDVGENLDEQAQDKPKYRPRYFSTNAISLSDKIQLVIRFYGSVDKIHENYDFVHCTCSYDFEENKVNLPSDALEAIINKELFYIGSKYPLCSIIRSRKFISRGWKINAGQYLKMALQLNELNLKDFTVFKDQLAGVDSAYFNQAIESLEKRQLEDADFQVDNTYLFEVINRIF